MWLIRYDKSVTSDPDDPQDLSREEFGVEKVGDVSDEESSKVRVEFPDFGRGEHRRPSFAVEVDWPDVRRFVAAFIEMDHPEALHFQRLQKLAEAIEEAGWSPDEPPTSKFFEIFSSTD